MSKDEDVYHLLLNPNVSSHATASALAETDADFVCFALLCFADVSISTSRRRAGSSGKRRAMMTPFTVSLSGFGSRSSRCYMSSPMCSSFCWGDSPARESSGWKRAKKKTGSRQQQRPASAGCISLVFELTPICACVCICLSAISLLRRVRALANSAQRPSSSCARCRSPESRCSTHFSTMSR